MTISIHDPQSGKDFEIPADREYVILQSLNGTDLTAAKAPKAASSDFEAKLCSSVFQWTGKSIKFLIA